MTRADYIEWAKSRALLLLDQQHNPERALALLAADLAANPETKNHGRLRIMPMQLPRRTREQNIRTWIEGYR